CRRVGRRERTRLWLGPALAAVLRMAHELAAELRPAEHQQPALVQFFDARLLEAVIAVAALVLPHKQLALARFPGGAVVVREVRPAKAGGVVLALRIAAGQRTEPNEYRRDNPPLGNHSGGAVALYGECRVDEDAIGPGFPLVWGN